ncbi:MAG: right-handed parallel beta-helix repeat-containing protein [Ardenticatenales bacterium]|nr:right-handed parallel beta-helix repeat-containing protein [Ardenticatenales bacterium]
MKRWILRILGGIGALLLALLVVAAALPVETDPFILPEDSGAGSRTILPSYTGLQREFPAINSPADNPTTEAKVALGRLLFYDPILSAENDISCAHCHHPDFGFSDGLPTGLGAGAAGAGPDRTGGFALNRNTPTLWNVAYAGSLFWDGRAASLEEQVVTPLTHPDEMAADPDSLVAELRAIDQYQQLFGQAFAGAGADAVTYENLQRALATFERSLLSNASPFDRYAAGQVEALTAQQRRGLNLFRSGATRCFECHSAPTFASDTFRVVGVPSDDPGRNGVSSDAPAGAFRVPTLRNIALTAPYMHDGSLATLEAVVEFYADGGGRAFGNEEIDPFVRGFALTEQEKADLVAFLYALTDERLLPSVPNSVPSGLPVVTRLDNPARALAAETNSVIGVGGELADRPAQTFTVAPGDSIQAAVDQARAGDTILIEYGIYHETVVVDLNDITIEGIPNDDGARPVLDGRGVLSDGIISSGSNFAVGKLHVRDYIDNGILVEGVTGVHMYDIFSENTGTYGLYPVQSTDVLIERSEVTGNHDAGIYAGQCENVVVRESVAYGNVIGIEIENTLNAEVYDNLTYENTNGIFIVLLPNLTSKVSRGATVYNNVSRDNNIDNFGRAGATVALLPPGVGILLLSSDHNEVYNNTVTGNKTSGIAIFNLESTGMFNELDIDPTPEYNYVHNNVFDNNGYDPDAFVRDLGIPVGDVLWDGTGFGNTFNEPEAQGNFPPLLPGNGWPEAIQRVYHRALGLLLSLVG